MTGSSFTRSPGRPCRSLWGSEAAHAWMAGRHGPVPGLPLGHSVTVLPVLPPKQASLQNHGTSCFLPFHPNRLLSWGHDLRSLRTALRCPGVPPWGCSGRAPGCLTFRPRHSPLPPTAVPAPRACADQLPHTQARGPAVTAGRGRLALCPAPSSTCPTCPVRRPWRLILCRASRGCSHSLGTASSLLCVTITLRNTFGDVL